MEARQEQGPVPGDLALETVREWTLWLTEVERWLLPHFARREARHHAWAYIRGLLSPVERKNGWQLAEVNGDATPYGLQHLLGRARWDAEAVRDDVRAYLVQSIGDPQAVLVLDEIGVFLAYASVHGHALLDRALYLPKAWTDDRERCQHAGVPAEQRFATKPQLARHMLQRAFEAGVPATWVTGDSVYGDDRRLRVWLEEQDHAYVMAVSGKEYVWRAGRQHQVKSVLAALGTEGWERLSAGDGTKGPRWYDWCWLPLAAPWQPAWRRWLLVRWSLSDPAALTAYVVFAPHATTLATVVQVAGSRWTIERSFEEAKGEVGLDHYAVRSWTGWYRHITLAMWAYALLTVLRAVQRPTKEAPKKMSTQPAPSSLATFKAARGLRCD